MLALLIVGIGLLIFGGIVLLKFPNRPGGKISVGTFEVSSVGAGLPLMVLGIICIFSYTRNNFLNIWPSHRTVLEAQSNNADNADGCFRQYFEQVPVDRISKLEAGIQDEELIGMHQTKSEPIAIMLTEDRVPLGAMIFNFFSDNNMFKIESIVDADCRQIESYSNASRGGDKHILLNWDTVEMQIEGHLYSLRLGYDGGIISANYFRKIIK